MGCPALVFGYAMLCGASAGGGAPADSVEPVDPLPLPTPAWTLTGVSVVEGAWSGEGAGLLQLAVVGVDAELPAGWTARVEIMSKWGHGGLEFAPAHGLSSLDAENFAGHGEAWLEWSSGGRTAGGAEAGRWRARAGWVDANSEFATTAAASEFANPAFGLSPALAMLPSYPAPAPSLNVFTTGWSGGPQAGAGVYRSDGGAWSGVAQLAGAVPRMGVVVTAGVASALTGPGPDAGFDPAGYVAIERPSAVGFAPFGSAAGGAGSWHLAGGFTAPIPAPTWLPGTRYGLGTSGVLQDGLVETVAEAFVSLRPLGWLVVKPHAQVRLAGGADPAFAGLLRVSIER